MSRRIKKWMAALMCGLLMMGGVVSVEAGHSCVGTVQYKELMGYTPHDGYHTVTYKVQYQCQFCKKYLETKEENVDESHDQNSYNDLGHQSGHDHKYEIYCSKCGGNKATVIITTCEGRETGYHTTP